MSWVSLIATIQVSPPLTPGTASPLHSLTPMLDWAKTQLSSLSSLLFTSLQSLKHSKKPKRKYSD